LKGHAVTVFVYDDTLTGLPEHHSGGLHSANADLRASARGRLLAPDVTP